MRTLYVDTETSGVGQGPGALVEIAVIDSSGDVLMDQLVNPMHPITPFCTRIHGITDEMVTHAPTWDEIRPALTDLLRGSHFVAHNAAFDRGVVGEAGAEIAQSTCTVQLCREKLGYPLKLSLSASRAGHVAAGPWHRAAADALACRTVHLWLNELPELDAAARRASRAAYKAEKKAVEDVLRAIDPRLVKVRPDRCPVPLMRGQPWTAELDQRLAALWRKGTGVREILSLFLRTPTSIFTRLEYLEVIKPEHNPYGSRREP